MSVAGLGSWALSPAGKLRNSIPVTCSLEPIDGVAQSSPQTAPIRVYNRVMNKNLHIEHPEDTILTGDPGFFAALNETPNLSVKIDGAPAIVWGTNPANGRFFVGTKSVFNKVKIKINHSHAEIDQNHVGEVATILHACLDWLPHTVNVYQGDFIGFGGSDEYTPNTITYRFPEVVTEKIIIAPHTTYKCDKDLRDAVAYPLPSYALASREFSCRFIQPEAGTFSGYVGQLDKEFELPPVVDMINELIPTVEFATDKEAKQIKQNVNRSLREGYPLTNDDFLGKESLMHLYGLVIYLKEELLAQCRQLNGPEAYIGQDRIDAEGYVMWSQFGTFKLVNRQRFSVANFNNTKFQRECAA